MLDDVSSFDSAHAMLHHLRQRYRKTGKGKEAREGKEDERSVAEVEAECVQLMRQNSEEVTAQQQDSGSEDSDNDYPYDDEMTALQAERITLEPGTAGEGEWSVSASAPLSASLSSLQAPFVLFQQCNLHCREDQRNSWAVTRFDTVEQLTRFLERYPAGHAYINTRRKAGKGKEGEQQASEEEPKLTDLLRRALHINQGAEQDKGEERYLSAVFHRARMVWFADNERGLTVGRIGCDTDDW